MAGFAVNTSISVKAPSVDISSYSTVNLGLAQGTTGEAYAAYIYDMWLE